ncbi:MAG: hypothetical protein JSS95_16400 [Acidobacteria bacterium]|nr:hypothetical protein [Acidobacteriota bacterium]
MRFLMLYRPANIAASEAGTPPTPEMMQKMGALIQKKFAEGKLLSTEGCMPTATGSLVGLSKGKLSVTDGPFSEAKEIVGGFALFQLKSKQEAIAEAHEFLEVAGDGEVEIRQIFDAPSDGNF